MTILGGKIAGLPFRGAVKFSFLLGAPTIVAASLAELLLEAREGVLLRIDTATAIAGFFASLVASLLAVGVLSSLRSQRKFAWFGVYCAALSLVLLAVGRRWGGF